jgi:hypothetical protein
MKSFPMLFVCLLAATGIACGQPAKEPPTVFRVLYIDRPFTEEESKAIAEGKMSSSVDLRFSSGIPGVKGKEAEVEFAILRNQISQVQTYHGSGPIVFMLTTPASPVVASIPISERGKDLMLILKPRQSGLLENAAAIVIASGGKEFPPGNLCIVNVTGFRLAFQTPESNIIISPDENRVFVPNKLRMDAVPLKIFADVRPTPRPIFEGAVRLSDKDRIMFIAFSPPGSTDVFKTDFFMLQPTISPASP